jgi:hypothetical protein
LGGARVKGRLHVGNNSLFLGGTPQSGTDDITSTGGVINLGGETSRPFNLPFSQIKVGVGITSPNQNIHIHDSRLPSNAVRQQFSNANTTAGSGRGFLIGIFGNGNANLFQQEINRPLTFITHGGFVGVSNNNLAFLPTSLLHISDGASQTDMQVGNNATGNTATDGFKFGITNTGIAQVKQQENLDMQFHTNNLQRMVIKNAGRVGINTNTPGNRLTISSAAGDPYFGAASSGLRFTNMTSASPTILNPSNKVLSVDANGDVVLVPDGPGGGGGTTNVTAQNGLSNISPSIVEWGGTLLHDTYIDQAGYNIWWHNQGAFTHGASIPLSGTLNYKFGLLNQNFDKAMVTNSSNVVSGTSSSQQLGLEIINNPKLCIRRRSMSRTNCIIWVYPACCR